MTKRQSSSYQMIEYPSMGSTYCREEYGVYEYGTYPRSSVLAGQQRRRWLDSFETLAEAKAAFPEAEWQDNGSHFQPVSVSHLPAEQGDA